MAPRARTNGTAKRWLYLDLLRELHAASERAMRPSPMNLTFSRPRAVERRNQWERIKGDLPPPLTPITRSADPSFHRSTGDDDRAHSSSSLARFAYAPFSLSLRGLRGNLRTSGNTDRDGGGRDPEGANNAHDEECALATLINEVLRLNGGTFSSVRMVGMSRHGF